MKSQVLRADLHVHSKYSTRPSEWFLRRIGCAESYTDPVELYTIAKNRGMNLVTISDHNTLAGSLAIAHLENTFLSEEITTYFPDDGCKLHVLAYDITERQHEDISRLRENVYDLVAYLHAEQITHGVAHPMYSINDRLTVEHFEQVLLLFTTFEMNGTRDAYQSAVLREILEQLRPEDIERLANMHDLQPYGSTTWKKSVIGGSDDHSSVNIASKYTEVEGASSVEEFLNGIAAHRSTVKGRPFNPRAMAHTLYSIAYQFYKSRFPIDRFVDKEVLLRFADRALLPVHEEDGFMRRLKSFIGYRRPGALLKMAPKTMQSLLLKEARKIVLADPDMTGLLTQATPDPETVWDAWFRFVNTMSDKILAQFADSILESFAGVNLFDIFHSIGSIGSLYTMLAPYFVAYTLFTKDRRFCSRCRARFIQEASPADAKRFKLAHFTDTFYDVNGVAITLKRYVEFARKHQQALTLITCGPETDTTDGVKHFESVGTFEMPLYSEMTLYYPPLLDMLDYCYGQEFTHIHAATPGPLGLAAVAIARILQLPIYGTYHTALPQYANQLSDDSGMEELMWKYVIWFYSQMDVVYVPSHATGDELVERGLDRAKIRFYPRGVDTDRFHPAKRNGFFQSNFEINEDACVLLYVGRVSREKNMPILVQVFQQLAAMRDHFHLVVIGDGPYLEEMKTLLDGLPVTFTGFLEGEELAQAYASSDLFVFPSIFFVDAKDGNTYPCGYRGHENLGKFWDLDLRTLDTQAACVQCDWECFRDPSELVGPILQGLSRPVELIKRFRRDPQYFRFWLKDLQYCRACNFFDGRVPPDPTRLRSFQVHEHVSLPQPSNIMAINA